MKKQILPVAILATLGALNAEARTYDNIIRPYSSARSTGMGGVRYTTGQFDENFFGNPAKTSDNPQDAFTINNVKGGKYSQKMNLISGDQPLPTSQPRTFNIGLAGRKPGFLGFTSSVLAFELQDIGNNSGGSIFRLMHFGGELGVKDYLSLRAGLNQGYISLGVGIDLPVLKLDLSTYGEEMSLNTGGQEDRRYALRLGFSL